MFKKHFIKTAVISLLSIGALAGFFTSRHINNYSIANKVEATAPYTNGDGATYYENISSGQSGSALLKSLQDLNKERKKTNIGYSSMWNYYDQTDYDPNNSGKYLAFYRGTSASKGDMNKEHVWPKSRGGNQVEGDIHMPRPTLSKDNSDRGNSFYVEGKNSTTSGWDPLTAGMTESYRGDSARIIFYCCVADSSLSLVDKDNDNANNKTMGKLSDLLKWNLNYPVQDREKLRNEGCESVQGNRNPFIDHPEYACKIWGNTNDATKAICKGHMDDDTDLASLTVSGTLAKTSYQIGEEFDPTGLTVIYNSGEDGASDVDVTSSVTWNPNKFSSSGSISVYAKYNGVSTLAATVTVAAEEHITNPVVGTKYQLAFANGSSTYFADGNMASTNYSLGTTADRSKSAAVYLEEATGGYYLKLEKSAGSAAYVESYVEGSFVDMRLTNTPVTVWSFDTTNHVLTSEISGCTDAKKNGTNFLCSYNSYTDIRISAISYLGQDSTYPAYLYAFSDEETPVPVPPDPPVPPTERTLTITGQLEKSEYLLGETFDPKGLTVICSDGTNDEDVTDEVAWNLNKLDVVGTFILKARYETLVATYGEVTIKDANAPTPPDGNDTDSKDNNENEKPASNSGGCKASIESNSSIVFIGAIALLIVAIRMAYKASKKE